MAGTLCILLHAHLPFVRHPEHPRFLEESWLFEAITETYIPLLQQMEGWERDGVPGKLSLTLSPTLCAMLADPLLQERYEAHLENLLTLGRKEVVRTHWEPPFQRLATFYVARWEQIQAFYRAARGDLLARFRRLQDSGRIEVLTTAATHAVLPLLGARHTAARAQVLVARDTHREAFGRNPQGIWLPECAWDEGLDETLREAGLRWFVVETHGLLHARPRPVYATCAPVLTPCGLAAFGRDPESARQVWSRHEGYPGDADYRDFYRDIGFDLDWDYLAPHLTGGGKRSFTGLKYYRITGRHAAKQPYCRASAMARVQAHAQHFLEARAAQVRRLAARMNQEPVLVAPYDAELFGHWWYEGPEFLDAVLRGAAAYGDDFKLSTPSAYLDQHPRHQVAIPSPSSWGEAGYWRVWLNAENEWIHRGLLAAQTRLNLLAQSDPPAPDSHRALQQAARELLLAQASDWPFIIRQGTSPDYARRRVQEHLEHFHALCDDVEAGSIAPARLQSLEDRTPLFPNLNLSYWGNASATRT